MKNKRRKLERGWRSTGAYVYRDAYVQQCCVVNNLVETLKLTCYTSAITDHSTDQKVLLRTVDKLMQKKIEEQLPPSSDNTTLHSKIRCDLVRHLVCFQTYQGVLFLTHLFMIYKNTPAIYSVARKRKVISQKSILKISNCQENI